jgi:hypothetical protein
LSAATLKNAKAVITARSAAIPVPLEEINGAVPDVTFWSRVHQRHTTRCDALACDRGICTPEMTP